MTVTGPAQIQLFCPKPFQTLNRGHAITSMPQFSAVPIIYAVGNILKCVLLPVAQVPLPIIWPQPVKTLL